MLRLNPTASALDVAPLDPDVRIEAVRAALAAVGIMCRRMGRAESHGITITYAHLSEVADAPMAVQTLADVLAWANTDFANAAGSVATTTRWG